MISGSRGGEGKAAQGLLGLHPGLTVLAGGRWRGLWRAKQTVRAGGLASSPFHQLCWREEREAQRH